MDKLSPKHFLFLMIAAVTVALKTYPMVFMDAGRDTWVAVCVSSVLIFVVFVYLVATVKRTPDITLTKIYQISCGNFLGKALIILYCVALFMTLVESASIESDSMHQNMLVETPTWYFLIFFIVPAVYVVRKNVICVAIIVIIGISLIMVAGIHLGILTMQQKEVADLFPIFKKGVTGSFWLSMLKSLGQYGFLSITLPYLSCIGYKREQLVKYTIIALLIIIQIQIVSITGIFMTFDPQTAVSYYYPKLIQTHLVSYFEMLEFGELYVMLQILGGWLMKYLVAFQGMLLILSSLGLKERALKWTAFLLSAVVLGAAWFASGTSVRLFSLLGFIPWISLVNFVVIPLIVFTLFRIRHKNSATQLGKQSGLSN